jgi:UDP-N-acetylglucosamine acyltransferase
MIHKTAIVSSKAELHESVEVSPYAIVEDNVRIDEGSKVGPHALVAYGARVGKNVKVFQGAAVGSIPQDLKFAGEESLANIGDNTIIREYVTVNRGTNESGSTDVGQNCLLMAYSHVAHDCKLAGNIIIGNCTALAGHVYIDEYAIISGLVPVHQFVRIGKHSIIGGGFRVPQDVCPYALIGGYPPKVTGLNLVGLKRRNFPRDTIQILRQTFKLLFYSDLNTKQAVAKINDEVEIIPEVKEIFDFIENSQRGLIK